MKYKLEIIALNHVTRVEYHDTLEKVIEAKEKARSILMHEETVLEVKFRVSVARWEVIG